MKKSILFKFIFLLPIYQITLFSSADDLNKNKKHTLHSVILRNKKVFDTKNFDIIDQYKDSELEKIPSIVPVTAVQQEYISYLFKSMLDVIEQKRNLAENDAVFGKGEFFWPKESLKPIKAKISYGVTNFKFHSISIGFSRKDSSSPWDKAGFAIHPRNFPTGFFEMNLSKIFFKDLVLAKAGQEERKEGALNFVNVFIYKTKENDHTIRLQFEASPTVSDINEGYPRSFHNLAIFYEKK